MDRKKVANLFKRYRIRVAVINNFTHIMRVIFLYGDCPVKTKNLIQKLYQAAINHDPQQQRKLYQKLLDKSLKHKYTYTVR